MKISYRPEYVPAPPPTSVIELREEEREALVAELQITTFYSNTQPTLYRLWTALKHRRELP